MADLDLSHVRPELSGTIETVLGEVLRHEGDNVHSLYVVGSSLTIDFIPGISDINTLIVLRELSPDFLDFIAPLGKKYGKKNVRAPLIMTPNYIQRSRDVYPVELLDMKLIHECVYGRDLLEGLEIDRGHLRLQCERELKGALINLRQDYVSAMGRKKLVLSLLVASVSGCIPVFRSVLFLKGQQPPRDKAAVVEALDVATEIDLSVFKKVLLIKRRQKKVSASECKETFREYYAAVEKLAEMIDALEV